MKTNSRTTRIFFTLLAHRKRHRTRHGWLADANGWGLQTASEQCGAANSPLIRLRRIGRS
jgi:hypothetical protein